MASRPTLSIRAKLLAAYVVPTLVLFGAFGWMVDRLVKRDLESELAARLEAIAGAAAEQVRGENVIGFGPHDEDGELYGILQKKLGILEGRMGVDRIYVFDKDHRSYLDSQSGVPVGELYYQLAGSGTEVAAVLADGKPRSSVLFRGKDGRLYKSGYAAVRLSPDDPTIVAEIGVDANARFFDHLTELRRFLLITGGVLLLLVVAASLVVGTVITTPLKRLSRAAERIGGGDLQTPVAVPSRDEVGFLATTLEHMRAQVHARDERMQMMLAGIAHEVRNPLAGIELFAGLLREELEGDAAKAGYVAKIERELTHLKAVVSDFLEYARRPRPDLRPVDLGEIVTEAAEVVGADAEKASVELAVERTGAAPAAGDREQLRRAILNLMKNAVQATPAQGKVTTAVTRAGDLVEVRISDTGKGIAADSLNRIFAPFFTTKEKGTGLGLAFAKEIVEAHGGTLAVTSREGAGTTFTITLPATAPAAASGATTGI